MSISYIEGNNGPWDYDETMTIKSDCYKWTVSFYGNKGELIKKEKLIANLSYQFCGQFCVSEDWTHFKVVETKGKE